MKKIAIALLIILALPYGAQADMRDGGTFAQFTFGLTTSIKPGFNMMPTIGIRTWFDRLGFEGTAYTSQITVDDSTKAGWGAGALFKVKSFEFGHGSMFNLLARGGVTTEAGNWKMDFDAAQYEVGPVLNVEWWASSTDQKKGLATELGVFWTTSQGVVDQISIQVKGIADI
jgi:hypothetical protein